MRSNYALIIFALASLLLLGVEGCPQISQGGTSASKYGIDFSPASGVGYISSGKTIYIGDSFNVKLNLENYDTQSHSGQICVTDNIADDYGGVIDECKNFFIKNAETIVSGGREQLQSSKLDVQFPTEGEYSYHDIPINYQAKLIVTAKYSNSEKVTGAINIPTPEIEKLNLDKTPSPISIEIEKTVRKKTQGYQIDLGITMNKIMSDAKISSPDFSKENYLALRFNSEVLDFKCTPELGIGNLLEFESTKFIRCSALTSEENQLSFPLIISLDYGVKVSRSYDFSIQLIKGAK